MAFGCRFVIIILIMICLVTTLQGEQTIIPPSGYLPLQRERIIIPPSYQIFTKINDKQSQRIETSTTTFSPSIKPTPPTQLYEIMFRLSNVGLRKIGPDFITSDKIISLSLDNNEISYISPSAFRKMRNLKYLNLSGNKIPSERLLSFTGVFGLQTLVIDNNNPMDPAEIEEYNSDKSTVDYGVFDRLEHLHLCNNQLKDFQINHLKAPVLTHLYLSNNSLESGDIIFNNIPAMLRSLHLDHNQIGRVEQNKLWHLHELFMDNNNITEVCFDKCYGKSISLKGANKMRKLFLSKNHISKVSVDAFTDTKELESLDLSGNKITEVIKGTFNNTVRLNQLSLADNEFATIPDICSLKYLWKLNLTGNYISAVYVNSFCPLNYLTSLSLANNNISTIGSRAFANLQNLKDLDLSGNKLIQLPEQWANTWRLHELHLERNNFKELDDIPLSRMENLKNIYLDENPMISFKAVSFKLLSADVIVHVKNMRIENNYDDYDDDDID